MTWLKIDDGVRTHPKIVQAGPAAAWQWFCGNCYCRQHLTDGFIPDGMLASLVPGVNEREARKLAAILVGVNLWHATEGGFTVHDFLDWNPTKAEVLAKRAEDRKRKESGKTPDSEKIPAGKVTDSTLTRAGGHVSPSVSSLGGVDSLEGGSGETKLRPQPLIMSPLEWDRRHGKHVSGFCDFVCFPETVFDDFLRRVVSAGNTEEDARQQVLTWAKSVRQAWAGRIPGDDIFKFWTHEWQQTHGSNKPAGGAVDVLAGLR